MSTLKSLVQFVSFFLLLPELVHGLAIDSPAHHPRELKTPSGRQRRAISALRADAKRHGLKEAFPRDVAVENTDTLIDTLWRENQDLVQQFLNNDFIKLQSEGEQEDTMHSYQYYSIQDYYYLVDYVQYKALRMTTFSETLPTQLLSVLEEQTKSIQGDIDYAWSTRNVTLATNLSVPLDVVDGGKRGMAQLAYSDWLQKNLDLGWFTLHVMSIPCIYGWVKLAERWDGNNATRKDTVFYNTWIKPNLDPVYGKELMAFLEATKDAYYSPNANQTWTAVFRQALQFEVDLFNSAMGTSLDDLA